MNWFSDIKIVTKIIILVGFMSMLTAGIGYMGSNAANTINNYSDDQDIAAKEVNMSHSILEQAFLMDSMTNNIASSPTKDKVTEGTKAIDGSKKIFKETVQKLYTTADERQREKLQKIEEIYKAYLPVLDNVFKVAASIDQSRIDAERSKVTDAMLASEREGDDLRNALQTYVDYTVQDESKTSEMATAEYKRVSWELLIACLFAITMGVAGGIWIAIYGISRPTRANVNVLQKLINNDLNAEIEGANRKDEVGDVARAALAFKEVLIKNREMAEAEKTERVRKEERQRKMETLIATFDTTATQTVSTVAAASTQLSQTAESMTKVAGETNQQSIEVASASEQASHNVQSVASAAEEMAATVQEISRQISLSNGIVRNAMDKAAAADDSSKELVEMSKSVGAIATLIEDIAGQINLLALNATIESARSGEAGKGFAVVANEVKNLATQTAKATEQIRQQLEAVQTTASGVANSLGEVREAIARVNEGSAAIAAAVEEQSAATQEIVSNMNTATQGVEQINSGIFSIKGGTDTTTTATRQVLEAARMLSSQAEKMDKEVKTFLHDIVAA